MTKQSQPDFASPNVEVIYSPREKRTHKAKNPAIVGARAEPARLLRAENLPNPQSLPKATKRKVARSYNARFADWKANNAEAYHECSQAVCMCSPSKAQMLLYTRYNGEEVVPNSELPE
jgi:hypothetical protein